MNNDLSSLVKLEEFDANLDAERKRVDSIQAEISKLQEELRQLAAALEAAKSALTKLQLRKKELELEIDGKDQQVKKFQSELNNVRTNDAYKAFLKEIDQSKAAKNSLEEDLLNVLQDIENNQKDMKTQEQAAKAQEQNIKAEIERFNQSLSSVKNSIAEVTQKRDSFAAGIAERLRSRYDSIRKSKGGHAVVPIRGDSCGGCRQKLTLHLINEVDKDQSLVFCANCARILYKEASPSPSPAS